MSHDVVLSSRLRLARNYPEYPFDTSVSEEIARRIEENAKKGLEASGLADKLVFHSLKDVSPAMLRFLCEEGIITEDLKKKSNVGGYFYDPDNHLSILTNEEDHLRFIAQGEGLCLDAMASAFFAAGQTCAAVSPYAYDEEWGYLTASPANVGTGFKASVTLHLPMITLKKKLGETIQNCTRVGMAFRGIYGENNQALGFIYQLSNRSSLGKTTAELIESVTSVAGELIALERQLRTQAMEEKDISLFDNLWRAYGVMKYARKMNEREFMVHWSNLRLGAAMGILPVRIDEADALLLNAQSGHIAQRTVDGESPDVARAVMIRKKLE